MTEPTLEEALRELRDALVTTLRIDRLVAWLAALLDRRATKPR